MGTIPNHVTIGKEVNPENGENIQSCIRRLETAKHKAENELLKLKVVLKVEEYLRDEYQPLQDAWEQYQIMLQFYRNEP